jgi:ribose 5-phosphate isomerase B
MWSQPHDVLLTKARMDTITDDAIRQVVKRVVGKAMGLAQTGVPPDSTSATAEAAPGPTSQPLDPKIVAVGADHGGFELKEILKAELKALNYEVVDVGTVGKEPVDYPDFALNVAHLVSIGKAWRGIVVDGAGIGSCIVANKLPGVRAGLAYDHASAANGREHNDTNVLTLGAGLIGVNLAKQILRTWLSTDFGGGRHARRVEKIAEIEKAYLR